jgi:hypothetical protein
MRRMHKEKKGLCPRSGRSGQTQCTTTQQTIMCIVGLAMLMQFSLHTPELTAATVGFTSLPCEQAAAATSAAALLATPDPAGYSQLC